jgi:hypothetical protein
MNMLLQFINLLFYYLSHHKTHISLFITLLFVNLYENKNIFDFKKNNKVIQVQ